MEDSDPDFPRGGGDHGDGVHDCAAGTHPITSPPSAMRLCNGAIEALPPHACRAARMAEHVAAVLGCPAGLVDLGGSDGAFGVGDPPFDLDAVVARWSAPTERAGPATVRVLGSDCVAFPVTVGARSAWIAAVAAEGATAPSAAAPLCALIMEMERDARSGRAALKAWSSRLEEENRRFTRAHHLTRTGVLHYDGETGAVEASSAATEVLGRITVETLDHLVAAFEPFDRALVRSALDAAPEALQPFDIHGHVVLPDGERRAVRMWGEAGHKPSRGSGVLAVVQDVTQERSRLEELRAVAEQDPLTGIANRTVFERAVKAAAAMADRDRLHAALFLVDVDGFKEINETLGQSAGDKVLKHVARTLVSLTRAADTVVRLAGDEFAVVVAGAPDADGLIALAERLVRTLSTTVDIAGASPRLSASIGIALYPEDVSPSLDLYRAADEALLDAKAAGRGRMRRFDPAGHARKLNRRATIARVRAGLSRGEFVPFFQPKIDLASGRVVGFEALCRWNDPDHGILGPSAFMAAFEDADVGDTLSDITLDGSFDAARRFQEKGLPFGHIAINLSRIQLNREDLSERVARLTTHHKLPARAIVFEVVENVLIRDERTVYSNLTALYRQGFRVALDDFGTGFASLTHIREPFIREVKIDRSFVSNAAASPQDLQIVSAIVQIARKLGLSVVAEGIEDEETLRKIAGLGCAVGQGFVFSGALPFAEAEAFLSCQSRIHAILGEHWP